MIITNLMTIIPSTQFTMNKTELISALAEKEGLKNKEASDIMNMIFYFSSSSLANIPIIKPRRDTAMHV